MKKVEVKVGNITYTHIGSPEAIESHRRRLEADMQVKANKTEKLISRESYNARNPVTEDMILKAKEVYQECKRLKQDRNTILTAVRNAMIELNGHHCTFERAALLITEIRKRYNIHTIKYWSD